MPYGVICKLSYLLSVKGADVSITEKLDFGGLEHFVFGTMDVKPYLRPMSSMTEEERQCEPYITSLDGYMDYDEAEDYVDWLLEHHFDYRDLIPMGLALEAPEDMYKED